MTTTQTDEIKTWQQRLEETCPALGPMHIHACVEEVNDAMQAEINDLRVALQEQAREGEAVAKVVLTKTLGLPTMQWLGLDKQFDLADGQLLYTTPQAAQPAHPSEPAQPVALPLTVDVCFIDGDDPFICTVHGKITVDALSEIEADIHENPDFGKGDGVYSYNVTRFNGQYGFEGRCELPPGWELDEIGYEPIEAAHRIGGGR